MKRILAGFILLLTVPAAPYVLRAQKASCVLNGKVTTKGGEAYDYKLDLEIKGDLIKGTSITRQDGADLKFKVKGFINKDKKVLLITETSTIGKTPDSLEMCFINAVLNWKEKDGKYLVSGFFVGRDNSKNTCSQGSVALEAPSSASPFFKEDAAKSKAAEAPDTDTVVTEMIGPGDHKITEGQDKRIEWQTNICTLEIWDGGVIDGDVVSVLLNNKEVLTNHVLTADKKILKLQLTEKTNTITIVADDEGNNPPNTAQVTLADGNEQYKLTAFNKKGKTASIVITRK